MQWWTATASSKASASASGCETSTRRRSIERVVGAAARPGQQADLLARVGELLGDGRADGAGSGDDVDGVHGDLLG